MFPLLIRRGKRKVLDEKLSKASFAQWQAPPEQRESNQKGGVENFPFSSPIVSFDSVSAFDSREFKTRRQREKFTDKQKPSMLPRETIVHVYEVHHASLIFFLKIGEFCTPSRVASLVGNLESRKRRGSLLLSLERAFPKYYHRQDFFTSQNKKRKRKGCISIYFRGNQAKESSYG